MGWEKILKGRRGISKKDIKILNYILRDGEFRTIDKIMDEIYDLIEENKELGHWKLSQMQGRPKAIRFEERKHEVKRFMTLSPDHESRDTGNKTSQYRHIIEYRYIGE